MARPPKPINWDLVDRMMEAGCTADGIAGALHIHPTNFCNRFKKQYGKNFTNFANDFHSGGKANVQFNQYVKAMQGNIQMLTLLGREWLGQGREDVQESPYQSDIEKDHEIMRLRNQLANLEKNGHESQAG